jgi:hypothetical protein
MTTLTRRIAALAAVALASAACSKLPASSSTATTAATTTTIQGASTPALTKAATYRAQLTYLMVEHVFLVSRVTAQVVNGAATAPVASTTTASAAAPSSTSASSTTSVPSTTSTSTSGAAASTTSSTAASSASSATSAAPASAAPSAAASGPIQTADDAGQALDGNSHDIADLMAEPQGYADSFGPSFYALWTQRIDLLAQYAAAKAAKDTTAAQTATTGLAANATAIATLVHEQNKYIAVTTVKSDGLADELTTDNGTMTTFIDDQASKAATATSNIVASAEQFRHTATILAAAASKLDPEQYPGTATGTAANLRAGITAALVEHVELAGLTADKLVKGQDGAPELASLAANTTQLGNVVRVNFGDPAARTFNEIWAKYVAELQADMRAKSGSGAAPDLSGVGAQVGAFFAAESPQFSASTIGAEMQKMVDALVAYNAAAASGTQPVAELRVAAATVPKFAADLAEGIAETRPLQYLP